MMHAAVLATLAELRESPWFSRLGVQDLGGEGLGSWYEYVTSPEAVIENCSAAIWEDTRHRTLEGLRQQVTSVNPILDMLWDSFSFMIEEQARQISADRIEKALPKGMAVESVIESIRRDIVGLGLECQFSDIVRPSFFAPLSFYYANGHLPCGWAGGYPHGRVLVY